MKWANYKKVTESSSWRDLMLYNMSKPNWRWRRVARVQEKRSRQRGNQRRKIWDANALP